MTKPSAQLLIVVHAWNDAHKLSRILTSIAANRSARDVPVLVVDNSSSASLGATVATAQRANTFHIDRRILRRVMRQLANGPLAAMAEGGLRRPHQARSGCVYHPRRQERRDGDGQTVLPGDYARPARG